MTDFETVDFFTDESLVPDPYPYFDHLRVEMPCRPGDPVQRAGQSPGTTRRSPVYKDPAFSSCVSVAGPFSGLPFGPGDSDDVSRT